METRKYKALDALRLLFMVTPFFVSLQLLLGVLQAAVPTAFMAIATARFVDTAIGILGGGLVRGAIYPPLILLLSVVAVNSILSNLPGIVVSRIKFALERKLMPAFIDVRASLSFRYIEDAKAWELISRVADKPIEALQKGIRAYATMLRSIVTIIAILGLIVAQVWWAVLVITAFSVPLLWIALRAGQKNYEADVDTRKYTRRHEYYNELLTNREAVFERTLFGYGEHVTGRYLEQYETARKQRLWVSLKQYAVAKGASTCLSMIALLIVLTLINPVITGQLSPGMFMGIVAAVFGMINMLGWSLQDAVEQISQSNEYMKDLTKFMELTQVEGAKDLPELNPIEFSALEFKNVRFKYPTGEAHILEGLSFSLEKGKHYAFVGANGAGKTTITKLLTGLYSEYEGEILINGRELRTYPVGAIKAMFSVVYQDFARYQISMADNIALGDAAKDIPPAHINEIADLAELSETIAELKDGINTPLGKIVEEGVDISGGQWQKIAIARSLLSRAPIKILDEPTAALDPIAESRIYQEFERLMGGKTTIFISHRLGSTKLADEILVIENGGIAERGSHEELMSKAGLYAKMFEAQRKWYE